ncbi:MAG TPA: metallophosphoesterase [Gaiellaceae bacterium]|nr:metallophosphoesterase [Gaiellaceae bacterium]
MAARFLHVSDLHVGKDEEVETAAALARLVEEIGPQLVVASGDLTHRGTRAQHERAAELLRALGPPVLAVPGNHDVPYRVPARLVRPWAEFERVWETTQPTFEAPGLHVVGLNSVRPLRQQGGALSSAQLADAAARLAEAEPGALRVAVLHHHLVGAPWRAARKRPVSHRNRVLRALVEAGADLILAGHIHQSAVSERHEFEVVGDEARTTVVAVAPGLGRPRPRRLGEALGLHAIEADDGAIAVRTYVWSAAGDWKLAAERRFPR